MGRTETPVTQKLRNALNYSDLMKFLSYETHIHVYILINMGSTNEHKVKSPVREKS